MSIDFWTTVVPQICRSEPAVWDAMIAISALFEHPDQCLDFTYLRNCHKRSEPLNKVQQEALSWYSRSISSISSQISGRGADPYIALISCILFICIETIQGRVEEALQLYRQGVSLILDLRVQISHGMVSTSKITLLEDTIVPLFLRLCAVSLSISGVQPCELYTVAKIDMPAVFSSVDSARLVIANIYTAAQLFEHEATKHAGAVGRDAAISQEMLDQQQSLKDRLHNWYRAYMAICQNLHARAAMSITVEPMLLMYHAALFIFVSECLARHEKVYDNHLAGFTTIVEQASLALASTTGPNGAQPPFTFEMGVGMPLFLTVMKCRDPILRRRALDLLRQAPPMQGFFKCTPVAHLSENFMNLEESYGIAIRELTGDHSVAVPEEARICHYGVFRPQDGLPPGILEEDWARYGCGPGQLFLKFSRNHFDAVNNTWGLITQVVPLQA
ncbi:hypothetical protein N7533_005920 [Penicillium manginii]|uniref:uncharacterized protein n=1 Tax=Penicillium manginii TaxID=203109 RepID=UPI00254984FB|nr:uncharacterized protein N7533_005920 [Penicillium manginii]KAJ5756377.1 hypothetical protein N7533_005920 [Penicillium manginii]